MFIASDESILYWGRTLLALKANTFLAGDEHFSTEDEHVENAPSSFSHTHTQLHCSYLQLPRRIYVEMIAIVTTTYLQINAISQTFALLSLLL